MLILTSTATEAVRIGYRGLGTRVPCSAGASSRIYAFARTARRMSVVAAAGSSMQRAAGSIWRKQVMYTETRVKHDK